MTGAQHSMALLADNVQATQDQLDAGIEYLRSHPEPDWDTMLAYLKTARQCLADDPATLRAHAEAVLGLYVTAHNLRVSADRNVHYHNVNEEQFRAKAATELNPALKGVQELEARHHHSGAIQASVVAEKLRGALRPFQSEVSEARAGKSA